MTATQVGALLVGVGAVLVGLDFILNMTLTARRTVLWCGIIASALGLVLLLWNGTPGGAG